MNIYNQHAAQKGLFDFWQKKKQNKKNFFRFRKQRFLHIADNSILWPMLNTDGGSVNLSPPKEGGAAAL